MTSEKSPYKNDVYAVFPIDEIPIEEALSFACSKNALRHLRETKGLEYNETMTSDENPCGCKPGEC